MAEDAALIEWKRQRVEIFGYCDSISGKDCHMVGKHRQCNARVDFHCHNKITGKKAQTLMKKEMANV